LAGKWLAIPAAHRLPLAANLEGCGNGSFARNFSHPFVLEVFMSYEDNIKRFDERDGFYESSTLISTWAKGLKRGSDDTWKKDSLFDNRTTYLYDKYDNLIAERDNETGEWENVKKSD
jgi:hypothetical protein